MMISFVEYLIKIFVLGSRALLYIQIVRENGSPGNYECNILSTLIVVAVVLNVLLLKTQHHVRLGPLQLILACLANCVSTLSVSR